MKKIYIFTFILLNLLTSCSSDNEEGNKLQAVINLSATTVSVGDEIKVINLSTSSAEIASYEFNFGNNETSTEKEPTFYYSRPGQYDVRLTIKDVNGATSSTTLRVTVAENISFLVENQNPGGSDAFAIETGIYDNKIFYTEAIRYVTTLTPSYYRHIEYDETSKTFTTKLIAEKTYNSGRAHTTFLSNGNKIVTFVESLSGSISLKEAELNSTWASVRLDNYSNTIYGSLKNNDQFLFYGSYDKNPAIEVRNSAGQFVSRKTYETQIKNAFIGDLIKTGTTYVAFGGKYEASTTNDFMNYKPLILFFNENLELTSQKTFETGYLGIRLKTWNDLNGSFKIRKLSNGNLAAYSHDEVRITTAQGEELQLISLNEINTSIQGLIEVENGFIISRSIKLEKYDNSGKLLKSISYGGFSNSGFVKKGDLIYFAASCGYPFENYSVSKTVIGAVDSNLVFKKI